MGEYYFFKLYPFEWVVGHEMYIIIVISWGVLFLFDILFIAAVFGPGILKL